MAADHFKVVPVVVVEDAARPVGTLAAAEQPPPVLGLLPPQDGRTNKIAATEANSRNPRIFLLRGLSLAPSRARPPKGSNMA